MSRNLVSALCLFVLTLFSNSSLYSKEVEIQTIRVDVATSYGVLLTEIHFDKKDEANAIRVKEIVEKDLIKIIEYFKYVPKDIVHINLDPYSKISNGNAVTFPTNIINLFQHPPTYPSHLLGINDWFQGVLFHEFIHITHLDRTKGLWRGARSIFGTVAKIPVGVVPSWFTEGIAVWGESYLLEGGRLNHPLFNKEMIVYFLRQNSCKTIDCLDIPGFYPNRSLSYIAGAHFLEYIENKKANSISCLVEKNASKIPFFLNSVFRECTGLDAQTLFDEFRTKFIDSQEPISVDHEAWGVKINNKHGVDNFQKGLVFDGEQLFKVEHDRYEEALTSYDVVNNLHMNTQKYDAPISEIIQVISFEGLKDEEGQKSKFILASFFKDPHFREKTKTWQLLDADTLAVEKELKFKNDPQYVFNLKNETFLLGSFIDQKWVFALETLRSDLNESVDYKNIITFDPSLNIHQLVLRGEKIYLKYFYNNEYVFGYLNVSDLFVGEFKLTKLFASPKVFSTPLLDDKIAIIETHDKNVFKFDLENNEIKRSGLSSTLFNRVDQVLLSDNATVVSEERIKSNMVGRTAILDSIQKAQTSAPEAIAVEIVDNGIFKKEVKTGTIVSKDYPSFAHFIPHYWFLTSGSSENISSIGVYTQFNDPMYYTNFELSVISYPEESKFGGSLTMTHKFQSPTDLLRVSMDLNREYFKSNLSNKINLVQEATINLFYNFLKEKWVITPGVFVSYKESNDFVTTTDLIGQGVMFGAQYSTLAYHETLQGFTALSTFQRSEPKNKDEFYTLKLKLDTDIRLSNRFELDLIASYSKQFKSDFSRGVIFGGGTNNFQNTRFHQFYGIPYSDAFGNEIITARAQLDYNVLDVYRGIGFVPVFLKEIHLLLGREIMAADRIVIDGKKILTDKMISSFFIGPRFDLNVFYYMPLSAELIFSRLTHSSIEAVHNVEFNFQISL